VGEFGHGSAEVELVITHTRRIPVFQRSSGDLEKGCGFTIDQFGGFGTGRLGCGVDLGLLDEVRVRFFNCSRTSCFAPSSAP